MEYIANNLGDAILDTVDETDLSQFDPLNEAIAPVETLEMKTSPSIDWTARGQSDVMEMDTSNAVLDQNYDSNSSSVGNVSKFEQQKTQCAPLSQLFGRFRRVFGTSTIERLKKFDGLIKRDSSFILECMKKLFGNDEQLKYATACGRNKQNSMTSAKRKIIKDIFMERLSIQQIDKIETTKRFNRLNKLINNAINNMLRVRRDEPVRSSK